MTYLLDVNVLIALIDSTHTRHDDVHTWFSKVGAAAWATCPITENGVVRIVGHPGYPNSPGASSVVARVVSGLTKHPGHNFWPDDVSLTDSQIFDLGHLLGHKQVTDSYLLGLAVAHGGHLATLDRRLSTHSVRGGASALCQIAV